MISGDVLAENTVMLAMCRSLGFEVKSDPSNTTSATSGSRSRPIARPSALIRPARAAASE